MRKLALYGVLVLTSAIASAAPDPTLDKAGAMYSEFILRESPSLRVRMGLPVEDLPDLSLAKAEKDAAFGRSVLAVLDTVPKTGLTHEEELSADILRREATQLVDGPSRYWLTFPVTPYTFQFLGVAQIFTSHTFKTKEDADRYERLLASYPAFLRSIEDKLTAQ